jgi:rhodanese-related sulfurtransferase
MKILVICLVLAGCPGAAGLAATPAVGAAPVAASTIPPAALLQPADLAATLKSRPASLPLILQVGFRKLFDQAHIPGSDYAGPGSDAGGLGSLRMRVATLPKDTAIVIYCGCCPWGHCPNVGAAYAELRALGFGQVKVLYIADDFGTDWIDRGYPVTPGG